MTTTKDALSTGSGRFVRIMLIEGIEHPIVECSEADAQTALDGTDWDSKSVYSGTFDVNNKQSAHPWEPFQPGGTATVTVLDDDFGILTHRTAGGAETELTATLDRDDADVSVLDTSAFPDSGEFHIGTECIAYLEANVTSTKFASTTRGMYSPFGTSSGSRYTHDHRVEPVPYAPNLAPRVTQYPRSWAGRWAGIWLHTYDENGINSKDDALCIFAGRLVEVRDDAETGGTVVICEHALTMMKDATVGRDQMTGIVGDGVYLAEGMQFDMQDNDGSTVKTANSLVVAVGATGVNQIEAGFHEHTELFSALNDWWAAEKTAGRLSGSYTASMATISGGELRTKIYWYIPGAGAALFKVSMPAIVAAYLGFQDLGTDTLGYVGFSDSTSGGSVKHFYPPGAVAPLRFIIAPGSSLTLPNESPRIQLEGVSGTFQDQYDTLPAAFKPAIDSGLDWGVFLIDQILVLAAFVANIDGTYEFSSLAPLSVWYASLSEQNGDALKALSKPLGDATPVNVRQVFMFEMDVATFLKQLMYSTGTAGFNHSTLDAAPDGCALGWPGELFGTAFNTSVDNLPGADKTIGVIIDKPTKLSELIGSDLVLRHTFPIWKSGGLRMAIWQTPTATLAVATLTESNKADPAGNKISPRSVTVLSEQWAKRIIKIRYNRSIADNGDDYKGTINVEDRTAIDDAGDRGDVFTINARNTYSEFVGSGAGIEEIVPQSFIPPITMFTRPVRLINRAIALNLWDLAPSDIISLTDNFARDPSTGRRKVIGRAAVIVATSTSLGGARPEGLKPDDMVGEVDILVVDTNRIYAYAPSALLKSYASSTKKITLKEHEYSESSEDDDVDHLPVSGAIRITEVDPADPSTALTYVRTISSKSGNDIVHDGVALGTDTGETTFDTNKEYRITFDTYSAVISGQQDKAFQADDSDGLIEDVAQPDMFGQILSTVAATASSHTDLPEFHAAVDYGDGKAYDVGSLKGFARLVDNLIDHKTAIQNPVLVNEVMTNTDYTTGYKLVYLMPVYLSNGISTNAVNRYLKVAPIFRSSDGTKVSVKITLSRGAPTFAGLNDVSHTFPISAAEFETTSTDWVIPTADQANVMIKGSRGWAWLSLECSYKAETVGIAHCHEGERVQT